MFRHIVIKSLLVMLSLTPGLVHAEDKAAPAPEAAPAVKTDFLSTLKVFGDVRHRYEYLYNEAPATGKESTFSQVRLRGRLGVKAQPTEDVAMEIRLATANGGTSTNQTYGDGTTGMRNYDIKLDRAYGKWTPCPYVTLTGGRMANPFSNVGGNDLVYDTDLNFDGSALGLEYKFGDTALFARGGQFILAETKDASPSKDLRMTAMQIGATWSGMTNFTASLVGSQSRLEESAGHAALLTAGDLFAGNSNTGTAYLYDYTVSSVGAELTYNWNNLPFSFYYEMDWNSSVDNEKNASIVGLKVNKLKAKGDWMASVDFRHIERDAVLGILSDSDTFGGGANGECVRVSGAYAVSNALNFTATYYNGRKNIAPGQIAVERDRAFVDMNFSF